MSCLQSQNHTKRINYVGEVQSLGYTVSILLQMATKIYGLLIYDIVHSVSILQGNCRHHIQGEISHRISYVYHVL